MKSDILQPPFRGFREDMGGNNCNGRNSVQFLAYSEARTATFLPTLSFKQHRELLFMLTQTHSMPTQRTFIYVNTDTQYANFWGNPLYQATKLYPLAVILFQICLFFLNRTVHSFSCQLHRITSGCTSTTIRRHTFKTLLTFQTNPQFRSTILI